MVIMAHPDDAEFICGGTVALWCEAGSEVTYLILTNGNKGSDDPTMTPEKLAEIRRAEQQAAAQVLGVKRVLYMEEPDGELQHTLELRKRVVAEIRRYQPEVVITFDPSHFLISDRRVNHSDHRIAGEIAVDAIFPAAGNRMYHPELLEQGLAPHNVPEVYLMAPEHPNRWVDVSAVMDVRIEASMCHTSQIKDPDTFAERSRNARKAIDQYGQEVYRELFRVLKSV
jgi:LmbE family N-acetylglucosaminyl deacetylase